MKCNKCGAETPDYSPFCSSCGSTLREIEPAAAETVAEPEPVPTPLLYEATTPIHETRMPIIGGLLVFLVAVGCILYDINGMVLLAHILMDHPPSDPDLDFAFGIGLTFSFAVIFLGFIAIVGSFYTFVRKNFPLSMIGAVSSLAVCFFTFGPIVAVIAIPGVVLVGLSIHEIT